MILGIPAAAHRAALLRETAGGGRVPVAWRWRTDAAAKDDWRVSTPRLDRTDQEHAIILHDPADPEAGAMGLARLAWVAKGTGWSTWRDPGSTRNPRGSAWDVLLVGGPQALHGVVRDRWNEVTLPALATATNAAHAIGLVCVHLGLLEPECSWHALTAPAAPPPTEEGP